MRNNNYAVITDGVVLGAIAVISGVQNVTQSFDREPNRSNILTLKYLVRIAALLKIDQPFKIIKHPSNVFSF